MKEIRIVIRKDRVASVIEALRRAGVSRLWVSHVHAVGVGVDPREAHLSFEEEKESMDKARIELFCRADEVETIVGLVREHARTGRRGDGVIAVATPERVVSVRTGAEDVLAII